MKLSYSNIYTNAVDLAKKINDLQTRNIEWSMKLVRGIGKEEVVMLAWQEEEEED